MSLANLLGCDRPNRRKLVCYEIALSTIAQQLPLELLRTGMCWVWESGRNADGTSGCDPALPDRRPLTLLTPDSAVAFAGDFAEHGEEYWRWMLIVGGANAAEQAMLDPDKLKKELEAFSESAETSVSVVIFQIGDSPYEEFVVESVVSPALGDLLQSLSERLGTATNQLKTSSGARVLKTVLRCL